MFVTVGEEEFVFRVEVLIHPEVQLIAVHIDCTRKWRLRRVTGWLQFLGLYSKMRWLDLCREVEEVIAGQDESKPPSGKVSISPS